jgi:hypothetical protein
MDNKENRDPLGALPGHGGGAGPSGQERRDASFKCPGPSWATAAAARAPLADISHLFRTKVRARRGGPAGGGAGATTARATPARRVGGAARPVSDPSRPVCPAGRGPGRSGPLLVGCVLDTGARRLRRAGQPEHGRPAAALPRPTRPPSPRPPAPPHAPPAQARALWETGRTASGPCLLAAGAPAGAPGAQEGGGVGSDGGRRAAHPGSGVPSTGPATPATAAAAGRPSGRVCVRRCLLTPPPSCPAPPQAAAAAARWRPGEAAFRKCGSAAALRLHTFLRNTVACAPTVPLTHVRRAARPPSRPPPCRLGLPSPPGSAT